ncbi:MAG: hypothetical protein ACREA3_02195 [Nitrosotalea sp.]
MDKKELEVLQKKIDVLIGLLTLNLTKGQTLQERVELLYSLGLSSTQIYKILGKPEGSITKCIQRMKKEKLNS